MPLVSMSLQRTPCNIPPEYDIDALLAVSYTDPKVAFNIVDNIYAAIEKRPPGRVLYFRPDSALLTPEVVVHDLVNFDMSMNSGFSSCLGYGGGFTCFFRALRALRILQHKKALALAETVRDAMAAAGAREPSVIADDNREGTDVNADWDKVLEDSGDAFWEHIDKVTRPLDGEWFDMDPYLYHAICVYLDANRTLLRCRKA